jgi:hypothetical protein
VTSQKFSKQCWWRSMPTEMLHCVCPSSGPKSTGVLLAWYTLKMKEICSSEMSEIIYQLTQCNNTKDSDLQVNWQQTVKVSSAINHVVLLLLFLHVSNTLQTTSCRMYLIFSQMMFMETVLIGTQVIRIMNNWLHPILIRRDKVPVNSIPRNVLEAVPFDCN